MSLPKKDCGLCGRELKGAVEIRYAAFGKLLLIRAVETEDCNWRPCGTCGAAICKRCYGKKETVSANHKENVIDGNEIFLRRNGNRPQGSTENTNTNTTKT